MADGSVALREQIARLRKLSTLVDVAAPPVAKAIRAEVIDQAGRQTGPDGKPWKQAQDGRAMMQGVRKGLSVRVIGTVLLMRLTGHHARHHLGAVRGRTKRPILPSKKIPDPVTRAIKRVLTGEFNAIMESGR